MQLRVPGSASQLPRQRSPDDMPFTPFHMGPGLLVKAILQGSFSLLIFGWTQIVMDLQPLIAIMTGHGKYHGFTHTYLGASLIAVGAALSGRPLARFFLTRLLRRQGEEIGWWVVMTSVFIGSYSHVLLDSIMHSDMEPLYPWSSANAVLGWMSIDGMYLLCTAAGVSGAALYFLVRFALASRHNNKKD